mmetsp:Transcript_69928/g.130683  ORF Transcript_69928/g.130683 Transcript_69928/m.130683 type:complete len:237 (-) Transcript_69928:48-758(-)
MAEKQALTRLRREYAGIQAETIPHVVAKPTESNLLIWHFVLHDLPVETPYAGGVYWGRLVFPKEYPLKPPSIYMMTPSGRFEVNTRLCLSMSDFHPESWNPSWRIESILIGLVSFMLDPAEPRTTGGRHESTLKRKELARLSFKHNCCQSDFRDLFPEFTDESKVQASTGLFFLNEPSSSSSLQTAQAVHRTHIAEPQRQALQVAREARRGGITLLAASLIVGAAAICLGLGALNK